MRFLSGADLLTSIRDTIATGPSSMAVAFWGDGACERLGIPANAAGMRVACDARSGSCNPSAIQELLSRNVAIVDVKRLHAKVYIGRDGVVVGSANASANGLGEEGNEIEFGLEAGYFTDRQEDLEDVRNWFGRIFEKGTPITEEDLPELGRLWLERQRHRQFGRQQQSFLKIILERPQLLNNRGLRVVIYEIEEPPPAQVQLYRENVNPNFDPENGEAAQFFWDVPEWNVQKNDLFLGFGRDGGTIQCDGVFRVQNVIGNGAVVATTNVQCPLGLTLNQPDKNVLAQRVQNLVDDGQLLVPSLIDIDAFAQLLQPPV